MRQLDDAKRKEVLAANDAMTQRCAACFGYGIPGGICKAG